MVKELNFDAFGVNAQPAQPTQPEPALPPAGHARTEELKRRADTLEAQAETQYADIGAIPHDSDVLNPERNREIRHHIQKDHLAIGVNHPYLKAKWVNYANQNGSMVWQAKADGWQIATVKEFPEAQELVREDNSIRIGDVILMFIRIDEHLKLEQSEKEKRLRQQFGIEAEIHDLAMRTNIREGREVFKNVQTPEYGGVDDRTMQAMESRAARSQAAHRTAARHVGNRMKRGTIPGVPIK